MNLMELKHKNVTELAEMGRERGIEEVAGMRKPDLIFAILQAQAEHDGEV